MKISFIEKTEVNSSSTKEASKTDDKKLKTYFKTLLTVFSVTVLIALIFISKADEKFIKNKNSKDYVSVFKESDLYEILFIENE